MNPIRANTKMIMVMGFVAYGVFGSVAERVSQNVKKFLNFK